MGSVEQNVSSEPLRDVFANLYGDVRLDEASIGQEFLIRVRVDKLEQDLIEITRYGDTEKQVAAGMNRARLVVLGVRNP